MNTQHFTNNDNQKFPLSTEALAFMQEQIKLAYGLTDLAGQNIIVKQSSATETGLVIYDGELLPLTGTPSRFITIAQSTEQVNVEGRFTGTVRTTRTAVYAARLRVGSTGTGSKAASAFTVLKSISTLMNELDEAKQHIMPKGSVIAWSGTCDCDHVPYGFIPCGAFFSGSASRFAPDGAATMELAKWRNKYSGIEISSFGMNNGALVGIRVTSCNGVTIPDLTDRFIVQAGGNYAEGDTGGANSVTLTEAQMPKHAHKLLVCTHEYSGTDTGGVDAGNNQSTRAWVIPHDSSYENAYTGGDQAHENRPPFYALCYLIKVI
ncbi:MAG: hypothetical protein IJM74_09160 [Bacteroidales bacterium]|nr:hypothetical protein [Bacteroidales bacterium]MBR0194694.1 hypothetical protein [Paludibacteraceae bacterium]